MPKGDIQEDMAWQDYMTPEERAEKEAVDAKLAAAEKSIAFVKDEQRAVTKTLKTRCDARMRRNPNKDELPEGENNLK